MTGDALDRACEAAYSAEHGDDPLKWEMLPVEARDAWRTDVAAALRVMADDLRELHTTATAVDEDGETVTYCEHCGEIDNFGSIPDCSELRILDAYTGGDDA